MRHLIARAAALLIAATATATLSACDPTTVAQQPITAPATTTVSLTDRQDKDYYECAAPVYGVTASYEQAKASAPAELAQVVSSGRELYSAYGELPEGVSVESAAVLAGLDAQGVSALRCAVDAFGEGDAS